MKKFSIFLVAILLLSTVCLSLVACNTNNEQSNPISAVTDGNGNDLTQGTHEVPSRMVFAYTGDVATYASSAVGSTTLSVSVSPSNATNKRVSWNATFVNANFTWASGKSVSTYLTLTPSSDTQSCTVTCLQAFGEQIRITVTSEDNASATTSCLVDFQKSITGANLVLVNGSERKVLGQSTSSPVGIVAGTNYNVTVEVQQSTGTVDCPYKVMRKMAAWVEDFPLFDSDAQPTFGWSGGYKYSGIMWNTFCLDRNGMEDLYRFSDWDWENETTDDVLDSAISYLNAHLNEAVIRWHLEITDSSESNVLVDKIFYMSVTNLDTLHIATTSVSLDTQGYTFNK